MNNENKILTNCSGRAFSGPQSLRRETHDAHSITLEELCPCWTLNRWPSSHQHQVHQLSFAVSYRWVFTKPPEGKTWWTFQTRRLRLISHVDHTKSRQPSGGTWDLGQIQQVCQPLPLLGFKSQSHLQATYSLFLLKQVLLLLKTRPSKWNQPMQMSIKKPSGFYCGHFRTCCNF